MRRLTFALLLVCNAARLIAQQTADFDVPLQRMSLQKWSSESGILSNNVTSAHQARSGYLWLTTYSGIFKFDGYKAEVFDNTNLPFITSNGFRKVYESPDEDVLYFASQGSGIVVYKNEKFSSLKASNGEVPQSIGTLLIENDGLIWIGSNNNGLYKYHEGAIQKVGPEQMSGITVLDIVRSDNGDLWVGTEGDGLYILESNGEVTHYTVDDGLKSNTVNTILELDNEVLLGTLNGMTRIVNTEIIPLDDLEAMSINHLIKKDSYIWIASDNGLGRINIKTKALEFLTEHEKGSISRVNWLNFDTEGSLWLSTGRDGLLQIRETAIINYTSFDGLSTNKINIVTENPEDNSFYIGCDDGNIFQLKENRITPFPLKTKISATGIRDILKEANGTIWIASYQGILRKRGNEEKHYDLDDGLPSLDVRRILKDRNGNIWLATRSGGLVRIKEDKVVEVLNKDNYLKSNFILALEELEDGIVVGTHSGGISIIKNNRQVSSYNLTENDNGIIVFNIHSNKHGLWLATNIGLFLFKENRFIPLSFQSDYSAISFFDILEDNNGNILITSSRGIVFIGNQEIVNFLQEPAHKLASRVIDQSNGMIADECTGATRSLNASNDLMYIPTIGGVVVLDTDRLQKNNNIPPVYVEKLLADDQSFSDDMISIPPGVGRYIINFTALSFISPDKMRFRYKLENFDKAYIETKNTREVDYTNLNPGKYTFHVMASNNDGIWNTRGATLTFEVRPYFYQTAWFILLLVVFTLLIIYLVFRWRLNSINKVNRKLRKVNSELDSFVYSASHDLRSPLTSLLGLIELSRKDKQNQEQYLVKMESSVKKLDSFIADIIDFSSNERKEVIIDSINFEKQTAQVMEELEFLISSEGVKAIIKIDQKSEFYSDRRRIAIILRNLISNALKYHKTNIDDPFVKINIDCSPNRARIIVSDNGIGIAQEHQDGVFKMFYRASEVSSGSGLGLYIVKETVEKLKGKINLKSSEGEGTTFTVEIPNLAQTL